MVTLAVRGTGMSGRGRPCCEGNVCGKTAMCVVLALSLSCPSPSCLSHEAFTLVAHANPLCLEKCPLLENLALSLPPCASIGYIVTNPG